MKNEIKIKLGTAEDISAFMEVVLKFHDDIDLIDGSTVIDAKSLVGVCSLGREKVLKVKILSDNPEAVSEFSWLMERFKVK